MVRWSIKNAEQLFGWMSHEELLWLAKQAQKHTRIVEIGSYLGRSTRALGDNTFGTVFAIDDFEGPRDINLPRALRENNLETFTWALQDLLESGTVRVIISDHREAQVDITPDMVFIDGSHLYEDVKRDINYWLSKIDSKGLICGHDYTNIIDVKHAVDEIFPRVKIVKGTSIWYVDKL